MQPTIYIGFRPRLNAFLIDNFLTLACSYFALKLYYGNYGRAIGRLVGPLPVDFLIFWVFPAVYFIMLTHWMQATLGKKILDLVVVDAETLQPVGIRRLTIRYLASLLSALPVGLGYIWIAFDERKQSWHDKIARTVVIYRRPEF